MREKIFTLEFWLDNCINAHTLMDSCIKNKNMDRAKRYARIATFSHYRILKNYIRNEHQTPPR